MSATISLAMIVPKTEDSGRLVSRYAKYFDDVVIQLAPKCKDFARARNKMAKKVKTDYYMWLDADDDIDNPDGIRQLVEVMEGEQLDALYLPYHYGYNEQKEVIALHWRERILRTSHPFEWQGAVHETAISESMPKMAKDDRVSVRHAYKTPDEHMKSALRNHKIMEAEVKRGNKDPRYLYYLGRSYFMLKDYHKSAQTLLEYTAVSGWDEQKYDAWMKIGDSLLMMDEFERALNANLEAIKLFPHWPDAYLKIGDLYLHMEQPGRAIEWLKNGLTKQPPETLEIIDPTLYTYRPLVSLALCYFGLAKVREAKKYIDEAAKFKPKAKIFTSAYDVITTAYIEEQTIKQAAWLGKFVEKNGKLKPYIDSLPPFIRNDLRLRPLRMVVHPPTKWPEKSIVFYCGEQWEEWGPDTLDKGMGGSEEAIVYLSRELAKLGWEVTVYNQRVEEFKDLWFEVHGDERPNYKVTYKPWETFNPEDEFDVFVAWRNPWMAQKLKIKARLKCVDMHDTPVGHQGIPEAAAKAVDNFFFKSEFQRNMAPDLPEDKCVVISNGIIPEHFDQKVERQAHKVIFASSADRGLDVLVRDIWPNVKKAVPDAELVWPYGWNVYDAFHKGDAVHGKWKWELKRDMFSAGVKELGRLSHEDLAKEMLSSAVWAYPTSFPEINCITALKTQAAGCKVVTSGYAALQETVEQKEEEIEDIHEKPEKLKEFTERLIKALKEPRDEKALQKTAGRIMEKYSWENIAKQWDRRIKDGTVQKRSSEALLV